MSNGAVLVYRKVYDQYWQLLPYTNGVNGSFNDNNIYNVVALATPGTLVFYYYVTGIGFLDATSEVQSHAVGDSSYRYVVLTGSQLQQAKAQHIDLGSLNSVQQYMNRMAQ